MYSGSGESGEDAVCLELPGLRCWEEMKHHLRLSCNLHRHLKGLWGLCKSLVFVGGLGT